jgi:hypothetical protein
VEPLGCHIGERAHQPSSPRERRLAAGPGGTGDTEVDEVGEFGPPLSRVGEQDVRRLHVAVHQPFGVDRVEGRGDLLDDGDGPLRGQRPLHVEEVGEFVAFDEPHVEEESAVDLAEPVHRDDVRLADPRGGLRLAAEAGRELRVAGHRA